MSTPRSTKQRQGPASWETLAEIHRIIGETLLKRLTNPKRAPSAALLDVARKYLANNGVDTSSIQGRREVAEEIETIMSDLPFEISERDMEMIRYDGKDPNE